MTQIIVGLDFLGEKNIMNLVDKLNGAINFYKIGSIVFSAYGYKIIEKLKDKGKKVFLDLKFFDIPNTVRETVKIILKMDIDFFTIHLLGGEEMVKSAIEEKNKISPKTKIIGVTVLTSFTQENLFQLSIEKDIKTFVLNLSENGKKWGIDGIVCSGEELCFLREKFPSPFIIICPGIRIKKNTDDQKRIITPYYAAKNKADFIVVGRPIYKSKDPIKTVEEILKEIKNGQSGMD